jgi:hypothetical protein
MNENLENRFINLKDEALKINCSDNETEHSGLHCIVCNKKCYDLICDECKRAIKWARLQMYKVQRIIVKNN